MLRARESHVKEKMILRTRQTHRERAARCCGVGTQSDAVRGGWLMCVEA